MTLAEYLDVKKLSVDAFAKKSGVHRSTIWRHLDPARGQELKVETIRRIVAATDGWVRADDLLGITAPSRNAV